MIVIVGLAISDFGERNVAVIGFGGRNTFFVIRIGHRPSLVCCFQDLDCGTDFQGIAPYTPQQIADLSADSHDLGHHRALELRAEAAFGSGRIPHAEQQRGWAEREKRRGIGNTDGVKRFALVGFSERNAVQFAIAQDCIRDTMRNLEAGDFSDCID